MRLLDDPDVDLLSEGIDDIPFGRWVAVTVLVTAAIAIGVVVAVT